RLQLMRVLVRDVGEVRAEQDASRQAELAQAGPQLPREDAELPEPGEGHRRVQVDALVAVGQGEETVELRRAHVRDDRGEARVPREDLAERPRTGVAVGDGPR